MVSRSWCDCTLRGAPNRFIRKVNETRARGSRSYDEILIPLIYRLGLVFAELL